MVIIAQNRVALKNVEMELRSKDLEKNVMTEMLSIMITVHTHVRMKSVEMASVKQMKNAKMEMFKIMMAAQARVH